MNDPIKRTKLDFGSDCYVELSVASLIVECRTEARASAISGVARINLSSLVKMYGFMHKVPVNLCHIEA